MKKICVVTGSRAEYSLLKPVMQKINETKELELAIIITGMHLSSEYGNTYKNIEKDGFKNLYRVEMQMNSDTDIGVSKSIGVGVISYTEILGHINPDYILILGDRYEIFAIASVASVLKIPIIHLHGGEKTEGAYDEAFRHCITKMSYIHFVSTEEYRKRVIQLGENPNRVFNVGALGVENIKKLKLISKEKLEKKIKIAITNNFYVSVFHPVTLEKNSLKNQLKEFLSAIEESNIECLFIKSNSDTSGKYINQKIQEFVKKNEKKYSLISSLTSDEYLNILKCSQGLLGNSSSGIIEAPSLEIGSLNIGDRQKGRVKADSTIDCEPIKSEILEGIKQLKLKRNQKIKSPYENGETSDKIVKIISEIKEVNLKKVFYDINIGEYYE